MNAYTKNQFNFLINKLELSLFAADYVYNELININAIDDLGDVYYSLTESIAELKLSLVKLYKLLVFFDNDNINNNVVYGINNFTFYTTNILLSDLFMPNVGMYAVNNVGEVFKILNVDNPHCIKVEYVNKAVYGYYSVVILDSASQKIFYSFKY